MPTEQRQEPPKNYLMGKETPEKTPEQFYEFEKLTKMEYGEVWGTETHSRRRKLILQKYPQISQLLKPTKPYSIILATLVITLGMVVCYYVKVLPVLNQDASWPVFLFVTYWVGGTIGHTLHVLIHDFTHWAGH